MTIEMASAGPREIRRLPPGLKLAGALLFTIVVVALPRRDWLDYGLAGCILLLAMIWGRAASWKLVRRLILLEPFAAGVAAMSLFQQGGLEIFLSLLAKSTLCLSCVLLLGATTPFSQILDVMRRRHLPGLLVTTLALTYRYLFVLHEEMHRLRRARQSRAMGRRHADSWRGQAGIIARLFVRASERAGHIYAAMCARGWKS